MKDIKMNQKREIENAFYVTVALKSRKSSSDGFESNLIPKLILLNRENGLTIIKNQVLLVKAVKFPLATGMNENGISNKKAWLVR